MYDLCTELALELHFPNNTGMLQIIYICMLVKTTVCEYNYPVTAYCVSALVNDNFSSNRTFRTIVIFGQTWAGPMGLFLVLVMAKCCSNFTLLCIDNQYIFVQMLAANFVTAYGGEFNHGVIFQLNLKWIKFQC